MKDSSSRMVTRLLGLGALIAFISMSACGGGGGSGNSQISAPAPVSITLTPATASIGINQTQAFTATVSNSSNTAVTWSVQEGATAGGIDSKGVYTSPNKAGSFHVIATSQADAAKTAIATVSVTAPAPSFSSTPSTAAVEGSIFSYTISAIDPANSAVSFSLTTGPAGATISGSNLTWTPTAVQARTANSFVITAATAVGGSATQAFILTPSGTIRANRLFSYITETGTIDVPDNTTLFTIAALVPNPAGGYSTFPGTGSTAGTYTIPNVPAGFYWLQSGLANFIWTNSSNLDMGFDVLGRPDRQTPTLNTFVNFNLNGLTPLQSTDDLQYFNANTQTYSSPVKTFMIPGATSLTGTKQWTDSLSNAQKGDKAYLSQLVTQNLAGFQFLTLAKTFSTGAFTQTNGTTASFSGTLSPANTVSFRANIKASVFAQLRSGINPAAIADAGSIYVDANPAMQKGFINVAPDLIEYSSQLPLTNDVDLGDISVSNPFPASWPVFAELWQYYKVSYKAPGASSALDVLALVQTNTTNLPTASSPLQPTLGPVSFPTINGGNFFNTQNAIGSTPTLAWAPPSLGSASGYHVSIYRLNVSGTATIRTLVASLYVPSTVNTIMIPPNLLQSNNTYFFFLTATSMPGIDYGTSPFRRSLPMSSTPSLSGIVTP